MIEGDPNAPILVVGMAPGKDELEASSPFVGASGRMLWGAATRAGFTRADCFILNTIGEIQASDSGPTPAQFSKYWDAFDQALESSKAKVALLLGGGARGDALWRVMGLNGIQGWRGYLISPRERAPVVREIEETIPYKTSGRGHKKGDLRTVRRKVDTTVPLPSTIEWVIPSLHPSFIMHTGWKQTIVLHYDVARVGRALRGTLHLDPPLLGHAIAFDIETVGSLSGEAAITTIGLCSESDSKSIPWNHSAKEPTSKALSTPLWIKIAHNIGFDLPRLEAVGVEIPDPIFCTMFACQMLQPDIPKGLNFVGSLYLDTPRWKHKKDAPDYNLLDVRRTRQLYDVVRQGLEDTGQLAYFQDTIMPAVRTYIKLTQRGIKVDVATQNRLRQEYGSSIIHARNKFWGFYPGVNPNSSHQLRKLFYDDLKLPPQKDHKGKVSVDKYCLQRLLKKTDQRDGIQSLIDYKALVDDAEYLEVPLDHVNCIHPSYIPAGKDDKEEREGETKKGIAGTGRPQAHDPNIMQVPARIRTMYVPHHSDWKLVEFDFDGAELRVAAAVSGDVALLRALEGPDLHQVNADLWGCTRAEAKTVAYGTLYGMGARKLHGIFPSRSVGECQSLLDSFFKAYPGLLEQKNKVIAQITKHRYLVNAFSRRRYFWNPEKDIPAALDFIPQSTVADIVWSSVNELERISKAFHGNLLTTIHDSFLFEFPPSSIRGACEEIKDYLQRPFPNVAPGYFLPVSYSIGSNWGELDEVAEFSPEDALDPA